MPHVPDGVAISARERHENPFGHAGVCSTKGGGRRLANHGNLLDAPFLFRIFRDCLISVRSQDETVDISIVLVSVGSFEPFFFEHNGPGQIWHQLC